jgi:hypothetical protein
MPDEPRSFEGELTDEIERAKKGEAQRATLTVCINNTTRFFFHTSVFVWGPPNSTVGGYPWAANSNSCRNWAVSRAPTQVGGVLFYKVGNQTKDVTLPIKASPSGITKASWNVHYRQSLNDLVAEFDFDPEEVTTQSMKERS